MWDESEVTEAASILRHFHANLATSFPRHVCHLDINTKPDTLFQEEFDLEKMDDMPSLASRHLQDDSSDDSFGLSWSSDTNIMSFQTKREILDKEVLKGLDSTGIKSKLKFGMEVLTGPGREFPPRLKFHTEPEPKYTVHVTHGGYTDAHGLIHNHS